MPEAPEGVFKIYISNIVFLKNKLHHKCTARHSKLTINRDKPTLLLRHKMSLQ